MRFTQKEGLLYAIVLGELPGGEAKLELLQAAAGTVVRMLGYAEPLDWRQETGGFIIDWPREPSRSAACSLKITPTPALTKQTS